MSIMDDYADASAKEYPKGQVPVRVMLNKVAQGVDVTDAMHSKDMAGMQTAGKKKKKKKKS